MSTLIQVLGIISLLMMALVCLGLSIGMMCGKIR